MVGTGARFTVDTVVPDVAGVPLDDMLVNVVGAFLLGWLVHGLARRGPDTGRRRGLRLLVGTGVLGGFTSYSALATDNAEFLLAGHPWMAVGYGSTVVLVGLLASLAGVAVGARVSAGGGKSPGGTS